MRRERYAFIAIVLFGLAMTAFAVCSHVSDEQAARDLCYPYALDAVARTTGEPIVICADGERRPLRF